MAVAVVRSPPDVPCFEIFHGIRDKSTSSCLPLPSIHAGDDHLEVVADRSTIGFSLRTLGRRTASWLVILRPSALSTFAPKASLLRLSDFSGLGWYRCCCRRWLFSLSIFFVHSLISCIRGSPFEDEIVLSEAATEGTPLYVEKRFEARFEETLGAIIGLDDSSDLTMM